MRTTIRLDDALLSQAKELAARTGRTLTEVIEDAVRQSLVTAREVEDGGPVDLPTFRGGGPQPGVDLDDTASLLALMEESR